ncbi:hypothetical protein BCR43DRAFT_488267 [Syncephalastrum racemosum]|uniref:Uncharacterized protein n=1 Tax=Syncephalastrum racemosum TaxID=13706 RepID=A0A1X2HID7_SYNRA|nr:hypothetical protein BCR43DRAFT_488267 [Syncephalastrum racemosum]
MNKSASLPYLSLLSSLPFSSFFPSLFFLLLYTLKTPFHPLHSSLFILSTPQQTRNKCYYKWLYVQFMASRVIC